jgi:N-acylneuraminate cytidylyltransferase
MCNRADGLAFDAFRAAAVPVLIMSTERNPVVGARARKLQVPVLQAVTDKGETIASYCREHAIELSRVAFVGNDLNDLPAMLAIGYPIAVADAHPKVKVIAWKVLESPGGAGVAREIAECVLGLL